MDVFEARRKSFEEVFFRSKDEQLKDKLRALFHQKSTKEQLREMTGVSDDAVLDDLVALDVSGESLAAFNLYPLIEMAWADGRVDKAEMHAVLEAAGKNGIARDSRAWTMLENALKEGPRPEARKVWYAYAGELRKALTVEELAAFRENLLGWARRVAEVSGGILNMALTVSVPERKVLDAIEKALSPEGA